MTGWIWPILVVFMLVMLVCGAMYVFRRARDASRVATSLAAAIQQRLSAAQQTEPTQADETPAFTQPLSASSDRYAQAHKRVIERKAQTRVRHEMKWADWAHFNE
ncbi:hypothetical protein KIMH_07550 [Bombiscardovia apis]|uniref:Uncharacterized protein n=1 Tax=Bombiscardovia apis TaxID=2932182 RepID=A0ABN6SF53_9BIFI|nr:hypothetical protein [Bombiscardovia apis]BDR54644.1 hypothetical protein KIMH_07550 [Bombiscardovia apis]